jgi:hypothetical protein
MHSKKDNLKKNKVQSGGLNKNNQWLLLKETNLPPSPQNAMNLVMAMVRKG